MRSIQYRITTWNKSFSETFIPALEVLELLQIGGEIEPVLDFCLFVSPITLMTMISLSCAGNALAHKVVLPTSTKGAIAGFASALAYPTAFDLGSIMPDDLHEALGHFARKNYHPIIQLTLQSGVGFDCTLSFLDKHHGILVRNQLHALGLPSKIYEAISYMVEELTQNLLQHSRAEKGLMAMQIYPELGFMDFGFSDNGNGFLSSYKQSFRPYPEVVDDETAMRAALDQKSTKNQPTSTGFGLYTTRQMLCHSLGGQFFMWSGKAYYLNNRSMEKYGTMPYSWPGSLTILRIPTTLPEGFDVNNYVA